MVLRLLLPILVALACAPGAYASGGNYVFDGGTRAEQSQARAALDASSFDWGLVPGPVAIHIGQGDGPHASVGAIWLDASLLDSGRFAWGVVQHEYAHQVDFALLTDAMRAQLAPLLGGSSWWEGGTHASLDCERFADALAWAYWPSPDNVLRPEQASPGRFRAVLGSLVHGAAVRTTASVRPRRPSPKG
jgi:hypothetical protein